MPLLDLEAPADFGELAVREHMDISNATENALDVTEWVASAPPRLCQRQTSAGVWGSANGSCSTASSNR